MDVYKIVIFYLFIITLKSKKHTSLSGILY